jgi:hypothetical protein
MKEEQRQRLLPDLVRWRSSALTIECAMCLDELLLKLEALEKELAREKRKCSLLEDRQAMLIAKLEQAKEDLKDCEEAREEEGTPQEERAIDEEQGKG